jgi:hypothetical protein
MFVKILARMVKSIKEENWFFFPLHPLPLSIIMSVNLLPSYISGCFPSPITIPTPPPKKRKRVRKRKTEKKRRIV